MWCAACEVQDEVRHGTEWRAPKTVQRDRKYIIIRTGVWTESTKIRKPYRAYVLKWTRTETPSETPRSLMILCGRKPVFQTTSGHSRLQRPPTRAKQRIQSLENKVFKTLHSRPSRDSMSSSRCSTTKSLWITSKCQGRSLNGGQRFYNECCWGPPLKFKGLLEEEGTIKNNFSYHVYNFLSASRLLFLLQSLMGTDNTKALLGDLCQTRWQ